MTLWPRSLLWRTVVGLTALLILASLAWLQIFRETEREPRARQVAQQIVSVVNLTRAALISARPDMRFGLLSDLSEDEGIQVYLAPPEDEIQAFPDLPFFNLMAERIRNELGQDTRLALSRDGSSGVWVSFRIEPDEYWVFLPRSRLERAEPLKWAGWGALVLIFALAGGWLLVARLTSPLRALTRAAELIGRGATPQPVEETGPSEIRTLARAFNTMAADLKRLDNERALLLAGVSHDLRTPLSRIRLALEMLDDKGDGQLREDIVRDIEDIDSAINQFLDFARLGDAEPPAADSDFDAVISAAVSRYIDGGQPVSLRTGAGCKLPLRARSLQRAVVNLVENALRHAPGSPVDVATGATGESVWVEVADRGPGIPVDQAERMLQPFTRLDHARSGAGTGLGLAIVDRIARMHGGGVRLLARDGGGLCARLELPLGSGQRT